MKTLLTYLSHLLYFFWSIGRSHLTEWESKEELDNFMGEFKE